MAASPLGQVFGTAGASAAAGGSSWAANEDVARVGARGEQSTARLLNDFASRPGGPTVIHDLTLPASKANIDHVVVSGRDVTVVDSKMWAPARYIQFAGVVWRIGGPAFSRGWVRIFRPGDKLDIRWQQVRLGKFLESAGVKGWVGRPVVVVWPSNNSGRVSVSIRHRGVEVVEGAVLKDKQLRRLVGFTPADPGVVAALLQLIGPTRGAGPTAHVEGVTPDPEPALPDTDQLS